jgi:putative transposase
MIGQYMSQGLRREDCLSIAKLTKNQYYYIPTGSKPGRRASTFTNYRDPDTQSMKKISNEEVLDKIVEIKSNPDLSNHYRLICVALCLQGYYINHKKVYRLMNDQMLLEEPRKRTGRNFVKFRRVAPSGPLEVLEMDIKYVWIYEKRRYAYILTVIDTFSRYVLHWDVGYSMKSIQVKEVWDYIVLNYLQDKRLEKGPIEIEVRNDNGKQFNSNLVIDFFKENDMTQVFTHPYTPEENGHIESFHKTLGKALKQEVFRSLKCVQDRLSRFYTNYNNNRSHGSTKGLPPALFWALHEKGYIEVKISEKRKSTYKLKVALQDIHQLDNIDKYHYRVNQT